MRTQRPANNAVEKILGGFGKCLNPLSVQFRSQVDPRGLAQSGCLMSSVFWSGEAGSSCKLASSLAGSNFPKLAVFECALSSYREPQRALSSPDVRALGPRQPQGLLPPGRCSRPGTRPMKSKFSAALQHAKVPKGSNLCTTRRCTLCSWWPTIDTGLATTSMKTETVTSRRKT